MVSPVSCGLTSIYWRGVRRCRRLGEDRSLNNLAFIARTGDRFAILFCCILRTYLFNDGFDGDVQNACSISANRTFSKGRHSSSVCKEEILKTICTPASPPVGSRDPLAPRHVPFASDDNGIAARERATSKSISDINRNGVICGINQRQTFAQSAPVGPSGRGAGAAARGGLIKLMAGPPDATNHKSNRDA
ncbi:hypothetical protein EVAR_59529_1 [Eumeta japonica]|uniref:Uncharacterized protein n=1 Tax=Eumeta variegata TaxID=151549 RepID=A0A4C1XV28_EUMVA|nr:hypothetical protein EVAR_59529_1 [Eumeta japonica]